MRNISGRFLSVLMAAALLAGTRGLTPATVLAAGTEAAVLSAEADSRSEKPAAGLRARTAESGSLSISIAGDKGTVSALDRSLDPSGEVLDIAETDEGKEPATYAYTGKAIKPLVHICDGKTSLREKADFTLSYRNNKNPYMFGTREPTKQTPAVVVKLKGNYSGTVSVYFQIEPMTLSGNVLTVPAGVIYSGRDINLVPEAYHAGKKLRIGKDFIIGSVTKDGSGYGDFTADKYLTVKEVGDYEVTLEGKGLFCGTKTVSVRVSGDKVTPISKVSIGTGQKTLKIQGDAALSSNLLMPDLIVKAGNSVLTPADYAIDPESGWIPNNDGKTAMVCASSVSPAFSGGKAVKVKLEGTGEISKDIAGKLSLKYDGKEKKFSFVTSGTPGEGELMVKDASGKALEEGKDFAASYENNARVGTGTLTIRGLNEYCTSLFKTKFSLVPNGALSVIVKDEDASTTGTQVRYEKGGATGTVTVLYIEGTDTYLLREKTDYTLKYTNNTQPGSAGVQATGAGAFKGAQGSCPFTVVKQSDPTGIFADAADIAAAEGGTVDGAKAKKTKITVTDLKGTKLKEGTDYKIDGFYTDSGMTASLSDAEKLSPGTVVFAKISMKNKFFDLEKAGVFRVYDRSKSVGTAAVSFSDNGSKVFDASKGGFIYTGSPVTPGYDSFKGTVSVGGVSELQVSRASSADGYFIDPASFRKNVNKGTASFMLYGTGSRGGSKKVSFKIIQRTGVPARNSWDGESDDDEKLEIKEAGGDRESAHMEWLPYSGPLNVDGYHVYYRADTDTSWTKADDMLVRGYSDAPGGKQVSCWRVDVPGLSKGDYFLKAVAVSNGTEQKISAVSPLLSVEAHDRAGYAFTGMQTPGAYKADGTLKDNAYVLYVTEENKDDVYVYVTNKEGVKVRKTGLQNILDAYSQGNESHPLDVRMIGCITRLKSAPKAEIVVKNNKQRGTGVTLEGIGNDAAVNGISLACSNASYVEVRNIAVMNSNSEEKDDLTISGSEYVWIHNCDLFYGEPGADSDQKKGDGAMDCVVSNHATFSYNHFWDTGKSILLGLSENNKSYGDNALYVTYHHNWFDHSDSRHPRTRFYNAHVYNNYYDGISKYCIGATEASSIFAEGNYFRSGGKPMLISQQGTDICGGTESPSGSGTFETTDKKPAPGGMIKAYNNKMEGNNTYLSYGASSYLVKGAAKPISTLNTRQHFDVYEVEKRSETVPQTVTTLNGANYYSNFDTAKDFYSYTADDPDQAREKVLALAGRTEHGDFSWEFDDEADDQSSDLNQALKDKLEAYKTCLASVPADAEYEGVTESKDSEEEEWVPDVVTITADRLGITAESVTSTDPGMNCVKAEVNADGSVTLTSRGVSTTPITITVKGKEAGKTRAYIVISTIGNGVGGLGTPAVTKAKDFEGKEVSITSAALGLTAASFTVSPESLKDNLSVTVNGDGSVTVTSLSECADTITVTVKDSSANAAKISLTIADTGEISYTVIPFRGTSILFFNTENKSTSMAAAADSSDVTVGNAKGLFYYQGSSDEGQTVVNQTKIISDKTIQNAVKWKTKTDVNHNYSANENAFVLSFTVTPKKDITLTDVSADFITNQNGKFKTTVTVDGTTVNCNDSMKQNLSFENVALNKELKAGTAYTVELSMKAAAGANLGATKIEVYMGDFVIKYSVP